MTDKIAQAFSISVIVTLALFCLILAAMSYLDGPGYRARRRARLLRALAGTRLHAVLVRRRIVPAEYLAAVGPASLGEQLSRCKGCELTQACDRTINCVGGAPPILGCPNGAQILNVRDERSSQPTRPAPEPGPR